MMKQDYVNLLPMAALLLVAGGCPAGPVGATGDPGVTGAPGRNALIATRVEAPGGNCGNVSGVQVTAGVDADGNGVLDPSEVDDTQTRYICDGAKGDTGEQGIPGESGVTVAEVAAQLPSNPTFVDDMAGALEGNTIFLEAVSDQVVIDDGSRTHVNLAGGSTTASGTDETVVPHLGFSFSLAGAADKLRVTYSDWTYIERQQTSSGGTCTVQVKLNGLKCDTFTFTASSSTVDGTRNPVSAASPMTHVAYCNVPAGTNPGDSIGVSVTLTSNHADLRCTLGQAGGQASIEVVEMSMLDLQ